MATANNEPRVPRHLRRITKEEMSANPFLFDGMDANEDGTVTAEELRDHERQKQPSGQ